MKRKYDWHLNINKYNTIKGKVTFQFSMVLLITAIILTTVSIITSHRAVSKTGVEMLPEIAQMTATTVEHRLNFYKSIVENVSQLKAIQDPQTSIEDKFKELENSRKTIDADSIILTTTNGDIIEQNGKKANIKNLDIFQEAMKGQVYLSSPAMNPITNKMSFNISAPIIYNEEVVNVLVATFEVEKLVKMISAVEIGEQGRAYIINQEGTTIAHTDIERVQNKENVFELAKEKKTFAALANIHKKMVEGQAGVEEYRVSGNKMLIGYAPIGDTGWSVGVALPKAQMLKEVTMLNVIMIVLCVVCLILGGLNIYKLADRLTSPIIRVTERAIKLMEGDLKTKMEPITTNDEVESLYKALSGMVENIHTYIEDIGYVLENLAKGNLDVVSTTEYVGDFAPIKDSLGRITKKLYVTISDIQGVSENILLQADRVSEVATGLSGSATEQAASIEELNATMNSVADQIQASSQATQKVNELAQNVMTEIENGHSQMNHMVEAMGDIEKATSQISEIMEVISQIASQTNLLALNAAIEAARAGEAGRGFAVVASEVRELAERSIDAAKQTAHLVQSTVSTVARGTALIEETNKSFTHIIDSVDNVVAQVEQVSHTATEQANAANEVTAIVEEISQVVQTTAATAQECLATSEELASEARVLEDKIEYFRLS